MTLLVTLTCTICACLALADAVRRFPAAFYAVAVIAVLLFAIGTMGGLPDAIWLPVCTLMRKCMVGFALFAVVMYIGALEGSTWIAKRLRPIRGELSILACIFATGHIAAYLSAYVPHLLGSVPLKANVTVAAVVAIAIVLLMIPLGITSIKAVRIRMNPISWKRLQRTAYLFFALIYIHVIFMLLPAALQGGSSALMSVAIYSIVFIAYVILRISRTLRCRQENASG